MIFEPTTRAVRRIPDLNIKPEFREPWRLSIRERTGSPAAKPVDPYWWRIASCGTIYRVDLPSGTVRRF